MTLELAQVTKVVGRDTHIHTTDLTLEPGTLNVILGPTLAGKTSLLRLMAGLDRPTTGRILWNGDDVTTLPAQRRNVAMVYQQFINYPSLSVYDNIASPLRLQKLDAHAVDRRVRDVAELLKLAPYLERMPSELSGGQQQRCALARALVKRAGLVLLDEPLANLDFKLREELRVEIPTLASASGAVFVYATTEPTEALLLGGNTAALSEGRVLQFGPALETFRNPVDATVARVLSDPPMNFVPLAKRGNELIFGQRERAQPAGVLARLPDDAYVAGFRANHVRLARPSADAFAFQVRITVTEVTGSESFIHLQHEDREPWIALEHGVHQPPTGEAVEVFVDPGHVFVFATDGTSVTTASG